MESALAFFALVLCVVCVETWQRGGKYWVYSNWRRWRAHIALFLTGSALGSVLLAGLAVALLPSLRAAGVGVLVIFPLPWWALWIVGLLLADLIDYLWHRSSHEVPWLWRLHCVHHSDATLDATTTLRGHPVHSLLSSLLSLFWYGAWGIPSDIVVFRLLLALVIGVSHHSAVSFIPQHWDRVMNLLVVSPLAHHIHHHNHPDSYGRNYGSLFSCWDKCFSSWRAPDYAHAPAQLVYGLTDRPATERHGFLALLLAPFIKPKS
ncbi:MAG: hypothetical protein RLZZ502_1107 [Pseudomonadota bacterium]